VEKVVKELPKIGQNAKNMLPSGEVNEVDAGDAPHIPQTMRST